MYNSSTQWYNWRNRKEAKIIMVWSCDQKGQQHSTDIAESNDMDTSWNVEEKTSIKKMERRNRVVDTGMELAEKRLEG